VFQVKNNFLSTLPLLVALFLVVPFSSSLAATPETTESTVFANVGDAVITLDEYRAALVSESRNRFYHGKPAEGQLEEFQKEIAEKMVTHVLLVAAAKREGISHDEKVLEQKLERYRDRLRKNNQEIDEQSAPWLYLRKQLIETELLEKVEAHVRGTIPEPAKDDLMEYYQAHPEKFTEPQRLHLSNILLRVDPSAGGENWTAAENEATDIVKRIRAGADFADMANMHSGDSSAENGGDMGYLHDGMLTADVQQEVEKLNPGEITDPLIVLEGIVILKLHDKDPGGLLAFDLIRKRAAELWKSEQSDNHWKAYVEELRNNTFIKMDEKYLTPTGQPVTGN
jgi:parvulin-like peptidyl-prolyl isomerase